MSFVSFLCCSCCLACTFLESSFVDMLLALCYFQVHHEFTAPIGAASEYAHPIEFLVANALPISLGPLLAGAHVISMMQWVAIAIPSTINGHSGSSFPWTPYGPSILHDTHSVAIATNCNALAIFSVAPKNRAA